MRESAHKGRGKTDSTERVGKYNMKESSYKSYDELPLFLNAATVAKVLGISPSSGYELMHEPDFPVLKIGSRLVVPKEKFVEWVSQHTQGGAD
jgi:predicted DNA-binding transcriptional regulator AlpA